MGANEQKENWRSFVRRRHSKDPGTQMYALLSINGPVPPGSMVPFSLWGDPSPTVGKAVDFASSVMSAEPVRSYLTKNSTHRQIATCEATAAYQNMARPRYGMG
jgi:hypothetical protein